MRTDRRTEKHKRKLRAAFRNFAKVPKNACISKMNKQLILYSEFVEKSTEKLIYNILTIRFF